MTWYREIGLLEITFLVLFLVLYAGYLFRVIRIAKLLHTSYYKVFIKLGLRTLMFILLIIALLGPSFGETTKEVKSIGKDMFIAVDLSNSMNAYDIQPTRLEKVKYELKNIVEAFSSDRIGLIIFSSEAFVQCPLTFDQNALNLFIETLHSGLVPNAGTDFAPPLKMALDKLANNENLGSQNKSKIIILISDGEDFGDESTTVAEDIEKNNIKLFTLGVGTEKGSKIKTDKGFKKDHTGKDVITTLDSRSLKNLATETGGQYFEINGGNNDVSRLVNTINSIEGELRDARQIDISANKYYYFLSLALILLFIDVMTSLKTIRI